ncbi:MAG: DUF1800 family protein [Acidobacteria bacterium]|nr:DUF1800 family protein [Acidobacteriota bacterium]
MMRPLWLLLWLCAAVPAAWAQSSFTSVSAASYQTALSPDAIAAGFGSGLAQATQVARTLPLPTTLAGTTVTVRDSANVERPAPLFFVSPTQINYLVPAECAVGAATVTVRNAQGQTRSGTINITNTAPAIFTADASGSGWPAAQVLRAKGDGSLSYEAVVRFDTVSSRFVPIPVDFGAESEQLFLIVYGTGWRKRTALDQVSATFAGQPVEVIAAAAQGSFAGLDQLNLRLPRSLAGRNEGELAITVSGQTTNRVKLIMKGINATTLFVANLRPVANAVSSASGVATLKLSADEKSVALRASFGNLTTAKTSSHVRGPADPTATGPVIYDLDTGEPESDDSFVWNVSPEIVTALKAGRVYLVVQTSRYPSGELRGHFGLQLGSSEFTPPVAPPPLPSASPTARDAARFLTQATFGPTSPEITKVQQRGYAAWLDEQFAKPRVKHLDVMDQLKNSSGMRPGSNDVIESTWQQAINGDDQLRQRVTFALHQILVVSEFADGLSDNADALATYYDLLAEHAFGNYRALLEALTLNPAMGAFQNVLRNDKEDPILGTVPNENYARELLQLFSIGLNKLHPDGSLQLDANGLPQATYTQETVTGFARVLTGWCWGGNNPNNPDQWFIPVSQSYRIPMINFPNHHTTGEKRLLGGVTLPANQTGAKDLKDALDNVFAHPNVAPFISRQLIQKLVTSNPSPAYVYRVASVFNNNGSGVRGDLRAVVRAILMDYEARSLEVVTQQGYGKLREPVMRLTTLLRAFRGSSPSGRYRYHYAEHPWGDLGQNFLRSPNVFNFFSPTFQYPGALSAAGLVAPEFQLSNDATVIATANYFKVFIFYGYDEGAHMVNLTYTDFTPFAATPATLVDKLDVLLLSGAMSPGLRAALVKAVNAVPSQNVTERVQTAVYLIVFAPEFVIQK